MDTQPDNAVVMTATFNAPVSLVWQALTDKDLMVQWYFKELEAFEARVGFQTKVNVHHNGRDFLHLFRVTEVMPFKKLAYSWKYAGHPGDSLVTFELCDEGENTKLTLTHKGLESFLPEIYPQYARENFIAGWSQILDVSLRGFVEKRKP